MKTTRRGAFGAILGGVAIAPSAGKLAMAGRGSGAAALSTPPTDSYPTARPISPLAGKAMDLFFESQNRRLRYQEAERSTSGGWLPNRYKVNRSWSESFKAQKVFEDKEREHQEHNIDWYELDDAIAAKIIKTFSA